jgi:hypothetical protein
MKRLLIAFISGLFINSSCTSSSGQSRETSLDSVKETISVLRHHGFFEKYETLNPDQLFDTLHQQRITDYSKMFEYFYDPGMELQTYQVLMLDRDKVVYGDAESGVGKGNNQYVALLKAFSAVSGELFNPTDIVENWESETGPIRVSFKETGEEVAFQPAYHDDWFSDEVFTVINQQMTKRGKDKFYMFLARDGWGLGQNFLYVRMTELQRQGLQKIFGWKFTD